MRGDGALATAAAESEGDEEEGEPVRCGRPALPAAKAAPKVAGREERAAAEDDVVVVVEEDDDEEVVPTEYPTGTLVKGIGGPGPGPGDLRLRLAPGARGGSGMVDPAVAESSGQLHFSRGTVPSGLPRGRRPGSGGWTSVWLEMELRASRGMLWEQVPLFIISPWEMLSEVTTPFRSMSSRACWR